MREHENGWDDYDGGKQRGLCKEALAQEVRYFLHETNDDEFALGARYPKPGANRGYKEAWIATVQKELGPDEAERVRERSERAEEAAILFGEVQQMLLKEEDFHKISIEAPTLLLRAEKFDGEYWHANKDGLREKLGYAKGKMDELVFAVRKKAEAGWIPDEGNPEDMELLKQLEQAYPDLAKKYRARMGAKQEQDERELEGWKAKERVRKTEEKAEKLKWQQKAFDNARENERLEKEKKAREKKLKGNWVEE